MVNYYKSKEILAQRTKEWLVQYSTAVEAEQPTPEWHDFCRQQLFDFGFGKKSVDKFLREEFNLKVSSDNKLIRVEE